MRYEPREYTKAIVGGVLAGLISLATAMDAEGVTGAEWVGVAIAAVATFAGVFQAPNLPRKRQH